MQHYTTIEQSKKLVELGLNPDTADMYIYKNVYTGALSCFNNRTLIGNYSSLEDKAVAYPCWSLAALLDIINNNDIPYRLRNNRNSKSGYILSVQLINHKGMNDFNKIVDCITWLLENNYIKSNKNE